jgi:hypothetical protein
VETLSPQKLTNQIAPAIPEEQRRSAPEVSQAAGAYFSALRERHARLQAEANRLKYDKLAGEQQA